MNLISNLQQFGNIVNFSTAFLNNYKILGFGIWDLFIDAIWIGIAISFLAITINNMRGSEW